MKKLLAILLVLCVIVSATVLVACGGSDDQSKEESKSASKADDNSTEQSDDEESKDISKRTPEEVIANASDYIYVGNKYSGRTFTVWTSYPSSADDRASEVKYNENVKEEVLSETVNEAIAVRNQTIEDKYGVTIDEIFYSCTDRFGTGASISELNNYILSAVDGDSVFQAVSIGLYDCGTQTLDGHLWDLNSLEGINMNNPWWEQSFNESATIAGKLYFTMGDISINSKNSTPCVYYNTQLMENFGDMTDPIVLANEGKWTIDQALRYSKLNCQDSADPVGIDYKDEFGWAGQYDDMYAMLYGSGIAILERDGEGQLEFALKGESTVNTMNKVFALMDDDSYVCGNDYFNVSSTPMTLLKEAFEESRCLFYSGGIDMASQFDCDFVYGILPVPKYNEEQEQYYSLINSWTCNAYAIATNVSYEDAEFAATMLDILGFYSWQSYPNSTAYNYYEIMLKSQKLAREDSEAMLDLIFERRGCELGTIFNIGKHNGSVSVNDMLQQMLKGAGYESCIQQYGDVFYADLEFVIDQFESVLE